VIAKWGCDGLVGMWWLSGDVVAQWGCRGSVGMSWLRGDVVALLGRVAWFSWFRPLGELDCNAAVLGSIPASLTVS
jgi:hypothetical protein